MGERSKESSNLPWLLLWAIVFITTITTTTILIHLPSCPWPNLRFVLSNLLGFLPSWVWVLVLTGLVCLVCKLTGVDSGGRSVHRTRRSYSNYNRGGGYYDPYSHEQEHHGPRGGYPSSSSYPADSRPTYSSSSGTALDSPRGYQQQAQSYPSSQPPPPPTDARRRRIQRTYSKITDDYTSLDQVSDALSQAGLKSSNLIVGIDFTKSNGWTGSS